MPAQFVPFDGFDPTAHEGRGIVRHDQDVARVTAAGSAERTR